MSIVAPSRIAQSAHNVIQKSRWVLLTIVVVSIGLNYLDRQLLAAVAPTLRVEYNLSNAQYGTLIAAFSFTYMIMAPIAGMVIDSLGLEISLALAVALWSLASGATALATSFTGFMACRFVLGIAEAAGIPCASKATASYLKASEYGIGNALQSIGITVGAISAPLIVTAVTPIYGWRSSFVIGAVLGGAWVAVWWFATSESAAVASLQHRSRVFATGEVIRDRRLWLLMLANALVMTVYSLWSNWTTLYLVKQHHLTQVQANHTFAWIPPIFATMGGFFGGWLSLRQIYTGEAALVARIKICRFLAPTLIITSLIPFLRSTPLATAAISLSFFASMAIAINIGVLPLDVFGAGSAAFTAAALTSSYALMQTIISPTIGKLLDNYGFGPLCLFMAVLPIIGVLLLDPRRMSSE